MQHSGADERVFRVLMQNYKPNVQELVKEVIELRRSVEDQGKKLTDLKNYIDTLVSRMSREDMSYKTGHPRL